MVKGQVKLSSSLIPFPQFSIYHVKSSFLCSWTEILPSISSSTFPELRSIQQRPTNLLLYFRMASGKFGNVLVEPHQKHVTGQSDLETALHTLLDHLREPFMAIKGSANDFRHVFNTSLHAGVHKPKNANCGYARVFAPRIDMRETTQAYYIDIELPGVHDASSLTIVWRSDRELLVEGAIERPSLGDILGLDAHSHLYNNGRNDGRPAADDLEAGIARRSATDSSPPKPPAYVVADEANGFEKNEDIYPVEYEDFRKQNDPVQVQRRLRQQANPFVPTDESNSFEDTGEKNGNYFPLNIVDGIQLDEGDGHRVQVPMHHLRNRDETKLSQASVTIGERNVGRFMRCFVFPHRVDVQGLRSEMVDGLLRIGVPKGRHEGNWSALGRVE